MDASMTAWQLTMRLALWTLVGITTVRELHAQQPPAAVRSIESILPRTIQTGSDPLELAFADPEDKAADGKKTTSSAKRIELPSWSTGTKADAWDDYFRRNDATPAAIRETVRALMAEKKHDEVIGLIEGAIRQKQAQPWMYEALGIAMQLSGRPAADIERVMMSAIDFSGGPQDLIRVAYYLSHWMPDDRALAQRSLKLYRQATEQAPLEAEIFTHALELAKRWDDLDAIEWSCEGILRFPWPHSQRHIPEHADQVATTKLRELLKAAEVDRAAEFKRRIDAARTRDFVIRVSWIGSADVDLLVEDPSGSLCSFSNPRSAGGGVLLRDAQTATDERDQTTKFEEYVCAEGLSGIYRMQIRRVWGKVNGDKVSIDFWTQRGTRDEVRQRQVIDLKDGEAVVNFQLAGGRREAADADPRIASTVGYQVAIGKAILAQQFGLPSSAIRGDQLPVSTTPTRNSLGAQAGYRPLIITLPTGANMSATAVVSSDRRYVRITAQPLFSSVPNVNTYNFGDGSVASVNAPISAGRAPLSPGTPGACAAGFNVNGCSDTPPVSGYVILFHPNRFQGAGGCATTSSPTITNVDQLVDTTQFNLANFNPPLSGANPTPPGPGSEHYNSLPQYTVINGFPAARFDAQAFLATRTSLLVNNIASGLTGMHFFMLGVPPVQTDNFNWDVIADYSQGQPAGGLPAATVSPGGFTIFYDNRLWAGVHTRTRHEMTVTDRNAGLPRDRNVNSLMNAVSTTGGVFYYGRTNSQDDQGATKAINGLDMYDFGFSSSTSPNGNFNTAIPFMHIPQPVPFDPLLPNFTDWGPYVFNDPYTYRFYKSNAAWDAYGALPPNPPNLLGYKVPNLRDVTVPDPATAILQGGKPVPGTGQGYWPQNEANRTPPIGGPLAFANPIPDPLPPVDTLSYQNLYDEWFPIPDPAFSPDLNDTRGPQRGPGTYRAATGLSSIPDRQSRRFSLGAAVNTFGHRRQDTDPSGVRRIYTHRTSDLFISIVVLYPRRLTFNEANQVATWMNCWGGAINYDRSTSPSRNPNTNVISDDRRRQIQQWPYTIP